MKTPLLVTSVSVLTCPLGQRSGVCTASSSMVLIEAHDEELLPLPPVLAPCKPPCSVQPTSSVRFQCPVTPDCLHNSALASRSSSLVDIDEESVDTHDESVDSDASSATATTPTPPPPPTQTATATASSYNQNVHLGKINNSSVSQREMASFAKPSKSHNLSSSTTHGKLLPSREGQKKPSFGGPSHNYRHTRLYEIDTNTVPNKHPPYLKAYSQKDLSLEEEDNHLPDIPTVNVVRHTPDLQNRSLTVTSFVPSPLPSTGIMNAKSLSQPDISIHSGTTGDPPPSCSPLLGRKLQVRELWRRAGQKLRVVCEDSEPDSVCWMRGPGDVLRPEYSRWSQRRDALAQPERMVMTQQTRERILMEVDVRRRSMKRRVSRFLTVTLGLNMEEDLAA